MNNVRLHPDGDNFYICDLCEGDQTCEGRVRTARGGMWVCTRPQGHDGPHYACGVGEDEHPICKWDEDGNITRVKK